jgi:PBP1b-binding outer membrane lipoprotein LpoB
MKLKYFSLIVLALFLVSCSKKPEEPNPPFTPETNNNTNNSLSQIRFFCDQDLKDIPTTYVETKRGRISIIKWVSDVFSGSGYDPKKRCEMVSSQFQKFYNEGKLNYLSAGNKNNQSIICGLDQASSECEQLFTLNPGEDAAKILDQLRDIASSRASGSPPIFMGAVVDFNQFMKNAPVESN